MLGVASILAAAVLLATVDGMFLCSFLSGILGGLTGMMIIALLAEMD